MEIPVILIFGLLVAVLLAFLFYTVVSISFVRLGVPRALVALLFISILVGGLINIPVWAVPRGETALFEGGHFLFRDPPRVRSAIIAVNVGGALIPLLLCLWLSLRTPPFRTLLATGIVTVAAYSLADFVPGEGIMLNALIPPLIAAGSAIVLSWRRAAPVAYIAGVVGTVVGADLLHLPEVLEHRTTYLSIGGAGVFDGIFLVGIVAAFLSPGVDRD